MLTSNVSDDAVRYRLILKTNLLVLFGYAIIIVETFIARIIGLTQIPYIDLFVISAVVITGTTGFILFLLHKKTIGSNLEKLLYSVQVFIYVILFSVWVYRMSDMRLFALFSSLFALIIVLSYTSLAQSLMISVGTVISYLSVSYYSNYIAKQSGDFTHDVFYSLCFVPTIIIISVIADQMNKKNRELEFAKKYLERANNRLMILNSELENAQNMTKIELELAQDIQKALFPEQPVSTNAWDIALSFKPRYGASGDFYDFYYEDGDLRGLSLFDVSGHGMASALITILAKPVFYRCFKSYKNEPLERVIEIANNSLRADLNNINMFITGIILRFNENDVEYVNAGHPELLFKNKNTGKVNTISNEYSPNKFSPVGLIDTDPSRNSLRFSPGPGDSLLLYSDCITESNNTDKNRYGTERLVHSFEEAPDGTAREILDYLVGRFQFFLNKKEMEDDFTLILAKKQG